MVEKFVCIGQRQRNLQIRASFAQADQQHSLLFVLQEPISNERGVSSQRTKAFHGHTLDGTMHRFDNRGKPRPIRPGVFLLKIEGPWNDANKCRLQGVACIAGLHPLIKCPMVHTAQDAVVEHSSGKFKPVFVRDLRQSERRAISQSGTLFPRRCLCQQILVSRGNLCLPADHVPPPPLGRRSKRIAMTPPSKPATRPAMPANMDTFFAAKDMTGLSKALTDA